MLRSGLNFINVLRTAFTLTDPESVKRYLWLNCIFYAFGIYERKSCRYNVDEIEPWIECKSSLIYYTLPKYLHWMMCNFGSHFVNTPNFSKHIHYEQVATWLKISDFFIYIEKFEKCLVIMLLSSCYYEINWCQFDVSILRFCLEK